MNECECPCHNDPERMPTELCWCERPPLTDAEADRLLEAIRKETA